MSALESDCKRAFFSLRFLLCTAAELLLVWTQGIDSDLFAMSVPVICTFPYACGFLEEYRNGFAVLALARGSTADYVFGKFFACGVSGGLAELLPVFLCQAIRGEDAGEPHFLLLFLTAFFWASLASVLAAVSGSPYVSYGGSFVICQFLIMMQDRYWERLYVLNPCEWFRPEHTWIFGETGAAVQLSLMILLMALLFDGSVRRRLARG